MSLTPPHDLGAEEAVLGACLRAGNRVVPEVADLVAVGDFYKPLHQSIWAGIVALFDAGESVDPVTVTAKVNPNDPKLLSELDRLADEVPSTSNAAAYATTVATLGFQRRIMGQALEVANNAGDFAAMQAELERLAQVAEGRKTDANEADLGPLLAGVARALKERFLSDRETAGLTYGFEALDTILTGLHPGTVTVVGARPSVGKTAFGLAVALNVAIREAQPVLFFSIEMGLGEIGQRVLSTEGLLDSHRLRSGRVGDLDLQRWASASTALRAGFLTVAESHSPTTTDLRARARRLKSRRGLGLIVVDYIGLMHGRGRVENRQVELSTISREVKLLARELDVPVLMLSQLNRGIENRADKRPTLADLRDTGALEQDADVVLLLHRMDGGDPESEHLGIVEVTVAKHRNGPTGTVRLAFQGQWTRFAAIAPPR